MSDDIHYDQARGDRLKRARATMREIDPEKRTYRDVDQDPPLPWHERRCYGGRMEDAGYEYGYDGAYSIIRSEQAPEIER